MFNLPRKLFLMTYLFSFFFCKNIFSSKKIRDSNAPCPQITSLLLMTLHRITLYCVGCVGVENHFELTFDALEGNILLNSSDVNASIHGLPVFERGIHGRALLVGGGESRVRISGAECLGGADACPMGRPAFSLHHSLYRR